ncbi:MAG: biopolymer transporter ExbD [Bacteroidota bacterium]
MKGYRFLYVFAGLALVLIAGFWYLNSKTVVETVIEPKSISLIIPESSEKNKDSAKNKSIELKITNDLTYHLEGEEIDFLDIEKRLLDLDQAKEDKKLLIVLRKEKSVPVNKVVEIMEIANKNKFKLIMAVN